MILKVIRTGSKGNAYLLENNEESLLIECGAPMAEIKAALNFDLSKVVGCLLTHEHGDHAKFVRDVMAAGINVYATDGTHLACGTKSHHKARRLEDSSVIIGNFKVTSFDVKHDAAEPCGFVIHHAETGNVLFMTDTFYCPYTFSGLNNIIMEANFSNEIIRKKLTDMEFLRNRILTSHMSLETALGFLDANDLSGVNNIVLIHLSDTNSNEVMFRERIMNATGKSVTVADNGLIMELNKTPF